MFRVNLKKKIRLNFYRPVKTAAILKLFRSCIRKRELQYRKHCLKGVPFLYTTMNDNNKSVHGKSVTSIVPRFGIESGTSDLNASYI